MDNFRQLDWPLPTPINQNFYLVLGVPLTELINLLCCNIKPSKGTPHPRIQVCYTKVKLPNWVIGTTAV